MLAGISSCPFIATSQTCDLGRQAVQEMDSVFSTAPADVQAHFQSAHDAIMSQYNSYSSFVCWMEIHNGEMCALGVQATQLANQIQAAMGQGAVPDAPTNAVSGLDLSSIVGTPGLIIVAVGAVLFLLLDRRI